MDRTVECGPEVSDGSSYGGSGRRPLSGVYGAGPYVDEDDQIVNLQHRVEQSEERIPLVSKGLLDKLVVNILLVVYVP